METSGSSPPKSHTRHGSSGRDQPRRLNRGPLDVSESPIPVPESSSALSSSVSFYNTLTQLPSPSSNLSTLTYLTAKSNPIPMPSSRATSTLSGTRDFSLLLHPSLYHPLTTDQEIPPPFRASQPAPETPIPTLISEGHFRSAAVKAAQMLTAPGAILTPADLFSLLYTRLACLTLCNQTALAAQEFKAVEDLNSSCYRDDNGEHLVPWELRVLAVRLQGLGFNDVRRGVVGYYDLVKEARLTLTSLKKNRKEGGSECVEKITLWEQRLVELGIRVASALVEMEDLEGASRFLGTLNNSTSNPGLQTQKALLWLYIGNVDAARACIEENDRVITALVYMADGAFEDAIRVWEELIASSSSLSPTKQNWQISMCKQNLGVSLLYIGRMQDARKILEGMTDEGEAFHALTFNLATIYELCTERGKALKIALAESVAEKLETARKQGTAIVGWEKGNGDFKL